MGLPSNTTPEPATAPAHNASPRAAVPQYALKHHPLLTAEEAAAHLRLHPCTVRRLLRQGRLPGARIGRDWRIPAHTLPGAPTLGS